MACFSTLLVRSRHVRSRAKLSQSWRLKQKTMAYSNTGVFGEGRGEDSVGEKGMQICFEVNITGKCAVKAQHVSTAPGDAAKAKAPPNCQASAPHTSHKLVYTPTHRVQCPLHDHFQHHEHMQVLR